MVGAFIGFYAITSWGVGFFLALLLAMVICAVLGVVIERLAYIRLRNATRIATLITAIGVSLLIEYTMIYFRGASPEAYPKDFPETRMIIYSLVLIFVMLYRPSGLMGTKEITDLFKSKRKKGGELK